MRTLFAVAVVLVCSGWLTGMAGAETIARDIGFSEVSTYRDDAAWLQGDKVRARIDGRVITIARAGRRSPREGIPFRHIDLGPDVDGSVVAVYDYCRFRRGPGRGREIDCDLFKYDVASRRRRPIRAANTVGADESFPTIWRGRLAFVREVRRTGFSSTLLMERRARTRRLQGSTVGDLRGTRRVYRAVRRRDVCVPGEEPAKVDDAGVGVPSIVVENLVSGRRQTLDSACETGATRDVRFEQFTASGPFWQADVATPCGGIDAPRCNYPTAPHIRHLVDGQVRDFAIGDNRVFSYGISDSDLYWFSLDTPSGRRTPKGSSLNRIPRPEPGQPPRHIGPPE